MATGTYYDFSRIAATFTNATNELVDSFITNGPTWVSAIILIVVLGVMVYAINKAGHFIGGLLDANKIFHMGKK